jgi:crotonobetainyl-CoA:carnitine CoA-transferase CaiB-like acyl-CoA transferase
MSDDLFDGLKVLDVGSWIAGPVAGTILADYGADVIKVEMPGVGDAYRNLSETAIVPDAATNYMWDMDARNKRSLSLNLKTKEGIKILHRLIEQCDVYITNQPFPLRDRLRLNYEEIKVLNPSMVYASLSAYGEAGPDKDRESFDLVAYWARSGLADLVRDNNAFPAPALPGMGDHPSAVTLYASIVTALLKRERTGEGSMVHTSLLANGLWSASCIAQAAFVGGDYSQYRELASKRRFPRTMLGTADERHFIMSMVRTPQEVVSLLASLGLSVLLQDERFQTPETRFTHNDLFYEALQARMQMEPAVYWQQQFEHHKVPAYLVGLIEEMVDDPQVLVNKMAVAPNDASIGGKIISHPINIDGMPKRGPEKAPSLGEHNAEILSALGFSSDQLAQWYRDGVI